MSGESFGPCRKAPRAAKGRLSAVWPAVWPARFFVVAFAWVLGLVACGQPDPEAMTGPQGVLDLVSPSAPLGLAYGERATLLLRYRQKDQPAAGVILSLKIDGDNTGATLSADRIVTNDRGEASVLFTAGAAEAAFHVLASAPLASDLTIDIAVSKFAFGNLEVSVDATEVPGSVTLVRGALILGTSCAALPPTPQPAPALRQQQAEARQAVLQFPTLLVRSYSVVGRAEDENKRLLAYGCIEVPDQLLRTGLRAVVTVPLSLVFPSPLGSYAMSLKLTSQPAAPLVFASLACPAGLGQVLLDAILQAMPMTDSALSTRLSGLRAPLDGSSCRTSTGKPDDKLNTILAQTTAGAALALVAADQAAVQRDLVLDSTLTVYAATDRDLLGGHTLEKATLATPTHSAIYSLSTLPMPGAQDLPLTQNGAVLTVPEHGLTLQLPALWRRALQDLVLSPRSITSTPQELFTSAIASAQSGVHTGCDAVEMILCNGVTPPCTGHLVIPCMSAATAAAQALTDALADAPPGLDFFVAQTLTLEDPTGTLQAQSIDAGQVSARSALSTETAMTTMQSTLPYSGTATGMRQSP